MGNELKTVTAPKRLSKRVNDFFKVFSLYVVRWDQWKKSNDCFLSDKEILVIECYRKYHHHREAAKRLHLSVETVRSIFRRAVFQLKSKQPQFIQWALNGRSKNHRIIKREAYHDFLSTPLHKIKMSSRLYHGLAAMKCENMEDVLYYSRQQMLRWRNFGKKSLAELEALLQKNGCGHLLKDRPDKEPFIELLIA